MSGNTLALPGDHEHLGVPEPDHFRDAARLPVLHALYAAGLRIETKRAGHLSGSAELVDEFCIRVSGVHWRITRHV